MNHIESFAALPPRESAVAACVRAIRESILSGKIAPGTRLPGERELAATFGVNRLTLRSALAQLAAAGLLSVRHGSGHVVRDFLEDGGPDLLPTILALAAGRESLEDLLLLRRALARAVLERAQDRIDRAGLARLERAVAAYEQAVARPGASIDDIARADRQAVRALLRETGSTVMALVANPVFRVLDALPELKRANYAAPDTNVAGFRLLLAALASQDRTAIDRVLGALEALDAALLERLGGAPKRRDRKRRQR